MTSGGLVGSWRHALRAGLMLGGLLGGLHPSARALSFEYTFTPGTPAQAQAAFVAAGSLWQAVLHDPVTVQLTVGTAVLGNGVLGQALSAQQPFAYSSFRDALINDATSATDATAIGGLPSGNSFNLLINRTSQGLAPYLDDNGSANNTTVLLTTANAAALQLPVVPSTLFGFCEVVCDAFIQFNSNFAFDYDRSNGITGNQFDFVGIAAHEIGHALGFVSGVDILDVSQAGRSEDVYDVVSPVDLFRYSTESAALGAIDFTAQNSVKYFSLTGAASGTLLFSNGQVNGGDGRQASHWKDGLGLGIMDPTSSPGEQLAIGANDRLAFDAIGWNLSAVPEPGKPVLMALGLAVLGIGWRRRARATR